MLDMEKIKQIVIHVLVPHLFFFCVRVCLCFCTCVYVSVYSVGLCVSWEPDPVEADPLKGSRNRRKVDVLGMIVGIIGSKDQLVNEYRVMLAEKLLNKSDYDIDSEIRTLELLKVWGCMLLIML